MQPQNHPAGNPADAPDAPCGEAHLSPAEKYTDLDRLKYALALFLSLLGVLVGITYRIWALIAVAFACVWLVDRKGRDVYRSFRRRRRIRTARR